MSAHWKLLKTYMLSIKLYLYHVAYKMFIVYYMQTSIKKIIKLHTLCSWS